MQALTIQQVTQAVADAIETARDEASETPGFIESRGSWIVMTSAKGEPIVPCDHLEFSGTELQLASLLHQAQTNPEATGLYIEGGFNWAVNKRAMKDHDYEPWASEWSVTVWERSTV